MFNKRIEQLELVNDCLEKKIIGLENKIELLGKEYALNIQEALLKQREERILKDTESEISRYEAEAQAEQIREDFCAYRETIKEILNVVGKAEVKVIK